MKRPKNKHVYRLTYSPGNVNYDGLIGSGFISLPVLLSHQIPQLVHVDRGLVVGILLEVEVPHTNLTEVTRVAAQRLHRK